MTKGDLLDIFCMTCITFFLIAVVTISLNLIVKDTKVCKCNIVVNGQEYTNVSQLRYGEYMLEDGSKLYLGTYTTLVVKEIK